MSLLPEICFVFIGGTHQIYHLAPVAAAMSIRNSGFAIRCLCADEEAEEALNGIAAQMSAPQMAITRIAIPWFAKAAIKLTGKKNAGKGPLLAAIRWHARRASAIIVPERTSATLRKMGWRRHLIHFRHGAGDRAPASESRLKAFDLIVVPGEKDINRAISQGINESRLRSGGYVKLDYLRMADTKNLQLFDNRRPTVIYNPHFDTQISSFSLAREIIQKFREQDRFNLIFAPHIRAVENLKTAERDALQSLAVKDQIIIDLGSSRLFDMSYTQAADIYLGDMSSQLYEFLARPRPIAFINTHNVNWQNDMRYAGWHLGEVVQNDVEIIDGINRAISDHPQKIDAQKQAVLLAFGEYEGAIERSASIVLEMLLETR